MTKYTDGQKVFAYVVMSSEGPNVLTNGKEPEGMVLIEKRGRGPVHTYEWFSEGREALTYWHCTKAGRGFVRGEKVEWDDYTKRQMEYLIKEAAK
ncbi:hypothetical protein [Micrococcus sp. TA1]|uniref:hypothetical protein n=1 Tax=Micrococcus sp. TA1 TaxID=681627 RepID=UPI001619193B|nr:hypothetical protein [Micrococcus sp. TA1]MBB5748572.1 hypothetical protein [Micrococcus sp. TA1]